MINEDFGFRLDKEEMRARRYAFSKVAQEATVRFYDEMSEKIYYVILWLLLAERLMGMQKNINP